MTIPKVNLSTSYPDKSGINSWHRELGNYVVSVEYAHIIDNSRALELRQMKERDTSAMDKYFIAKLQGAEGYTRHLSIEQFLEHHIPTTTRQHYASHVSLSMDSLKYLSRDVEQAWLAEEYSKGGWGIFPCTNEDRSMLSLMLENFTRNTIEFVMRDKLDTVHSPLQQNPNKQGNIPEESAEEHSDKDERVKQRRGE
ncbi:hypothetical protein BU17DRAFT_69144 [Hysterangium stoloniferum]|nr:hypothetical protein BU17DRAFT_69144 [Hysterangium stoloniferum]